MKGNGLEKKIPCVNCDLDLGDKTLSEGHDTIVWYIIKIQNGSKELWVQNTVQCNLSNPALV